MTMQEVQASGGMDGPGALGTRANDYYRQMADITRLRSDRDALTILQEQVRRDITQGGALTQSTVDRLKAFGASGVGQIIAEGHDPAAVLTSLRTEVNFITDEVERLENEVITNFPDYAQFDFSPLRIDAIWGDFARRGSSGPGHAPAPMQIVAGPQGDIFSFNPNTGGVSKVGNFPELAQRNMTAQVDRNGNLVAFDINDPTKPPVILQEGFGFAQVDPQVEFAENVRQFEEMLALRQQEVAQQFMGLELQRRGMMVQALSNDFAHQIALGRMTYEEANTQLNRINSALDQRRAEREQLLQFAVKRSSLRQDGGELVTMLPGGAQLMSLMSRVTGEQFDPSVAELPVGFIDPEGAARQVMSASQFQSPLPGLQQNLNSTREAINAIIGAPLGTGMVNQQATDDVVAGI